MNGATMKALCVTAIALTLVVQCCCVEKPEPVGNTGEYGVIHPSPWIPSTRPKPSVYRYPLPWIAPWHGPKDPIWPFPWRLSQRTDYTLKGLSTEEISTEEQPNSRQRRAPVVVPNPWSKPWRYPWPRPVPRP